MPEVNITKILGETQNEMWSRTGQAFLFLGGFSLVGVSVGPFTLSAVASHVPFVMVGLGGFGMWYGTKLKQRLHEKQQAHERAMRKRPEATKGMTEILEFLRQRGPMTREEIIREADKFKYDSAKTKSQMLHALLVHRADWWADHYPDVVKREGNQYSVINSDSTVFLGEDTKR